MALFHHRSLGQWKSISTRGALKLAAANIPFENSSTAFGALHPYGQSNILEIVNTTILVRKSTEKVFEQHRSVFFHKSSCILAIYKDIYIELTKISTAITTQNKSGTNDFTLINMWFMRLKNVKLTYNLPKVIVHNLNISNLSVYLDVQNSLLLTNYKGLDPEMEKNSAPFPISKTFVIGVNIAF
jgi:hypothetical protein